MRLGALIVVTVALLTGCPKHSSSGDAGHSDAGSGDGGTSDGGVNRQIIMRSMMSTSVDNLIRDPFVGGEGGALYEQFIGYYGNGYDVPLTRTFQSASPVRGTASIEELRDLPDDAGVFADITMTVTFRGGPGDYTASMWVSAGDSSSKPLPFSRVASKLQMVLFDNEGLTKTTLTPGPVTKFGDREWVQFKTAEPLEMPKGGWLVFRTFDPHTALQFAMPEVTTTGLQPKSHGAHHGTPQTDEDRATLELAWKVARARSGTPPSMREPGPPSPAPY